MCSLFMITFFKVETNSEALRDSAAGGSAETDQNGRIKSGSGAEKRSPFLFGFIFVSC